MATSSSPFLRLTTAIQDYPYGKRGADSAAARYAVATPENNFTIDPSHPYGEIWMGDHPNGRAHVIGTGKTLADLIAANPEQYLTAGVYKRFNNDPHLPFLFKVLSFEKALPLQAHPDKGLAKRLKAQEKKEKGKNENFVDENHKPEVAVALSEVFDGFVGFRPIAEIQEFVRTVPELREVLCSSPESASAVESFLATPDSDAAAHEKLLKTLFSAALHCPSSTLTEQSKKLLAPSRGDFSPAFPELTPVAHKIWTDYPNDAGLFAAVFLMNFVRLPRGRGIAVPADCIHAYLHGDVIECMAWSDNMIACGFQDASENNDASVFVDMLDYRACPSSELELKHGVWEKSGRGKTERFEAPMEEFDLLCTRLGACEGEETPGVSGPSVWIVTEGEAVMNHMASGEFMFIEEFDITSPRLH
ncbi:RmlC-like cupin domain-containing protein [Geopyxis carbonaria]|nr:RmlC-like cupin domain-containing protein [Geopyxis carbonaria]